MLRETEKQMSFYSVLYERIPENHLLKRIYKTMTNSGLSVFFKTICTPQYFC